MRLLRRYLLYMIVFLLFKPFPGGSFTWADSRTQGHEGLACSKCHVTDHRGHPPKTLRYYDDIPRLCLSCHRGVMNHPVGNRLKGRALLFARLLNLPLGWKRYEKRVICTTCHEIHTDSNHPYLLRDPSFQSEEGGPESSSSVVTLCDGCHSDDFFNHDPHTGRESECKYCHLVTTSRLKESRKLRAFLAKYSCTPCHQPKCKDFEEYNPFKDPIVQQMAHDKGVEYWDGRAICANCHDAHGKVPGDHLARPEYLPFAWSSRSINPHWKRLFCLCCHREVPGEGVLSLKYSNFNTLCERCHDNSFARADIHIVGVRPKNVTVPKDLPLQNGRLTCETCHDASIQCTGNRKKAKENPLFLRRDGLSRYEFCFLCHKPKAFQRLNPHIHQRDDKGRIVKKRCLFCHSSVPDPEHMRGVGEVKFSVKDPDECCRGCHQGFEFFHPGGFTHIGVRPSKKIMSAIETSLERLGIEVPLYQGRIMCATCHNPHEIGVIKFKAASIGSTRPNRLRLSHTREMCVVCHVDKAYRGRDKAITSNDDRIWQSFLDID